MQCFRARCLPRGATKRLPLEGKSPQQPTGERADLRLRPPVTSLLSLRPPAPPRPSRPETPPLGGSRNVSEFSSLLALVYDCVTEKTSGPVRIGLRSCESRGGFFCFSHGRTQKVEQQDPFLETPGRRSSPAPLAASDQGPAQKRPRGADAHPRLPSPRTGRRARSRFAEKGPSGAWATPSGGGGSKRNGRSPRRWIEWEKDE